jgi:hypothetical protein
MTSRIPSLLIATLVEVAIPSGLVRSKSLKIFACTTHCVTAQEVTDSYRELVTALAHGHIRIDAARTRGQGLGAAAGRPPSQARYLPLRAPAASTARSVRHSQVGRRGVRDAVGELRWRDLGGHLPVLLAARPGDRFLAHRLQQREVAGVGQLPLPLPSRESSLTSGPRDVVVEGAERFGREPVTTYSSRALLSVQEAEL